MLNKQLSYLDKVITKTLKENLKKNDVQESGIVIKVDSGIALIRGLKGIKSQELIQFPKNLYGLAFNLDPDSVGVILLGDYNHVKAGDRVKRTYAVVEIPVSNKYLGRVISPLGRVLDNKESINVSKTLPIERQARTILERAPVNKPLQTGIKVIDSVVPIGRGQRELILGDRQTGKTTIAIDTIINQKDEDVICIYCAIGQQTTSISKTIDTLKANGAMDYTIIMVAPAEDPPGVSYIAPYAATSLGEYFMEQGKDVLIIYDDLTRHARSYRELSLLLERPPGREAFPGDIFYIHSRLLERSTHLKEEFGGGSMTALPIIETQGENLSAYISTNLISITDGQIYLSPKLYQKGHLPAVNIGTSVSRIGSKTQIPSYRSITSALKLTYSQFEELEAFSSFGTRLDSKTEKTLRRGRRIRAILNQPQYSPVHVSEQIAVLMAVLGGLLDNIEVDDIDRAEVIIRDLVKADNNFKNSLLLDVAIEDKEKEAFLDSVKLALAKEFDL